MTRDYMMAGKPVLLPRGGSRISRKGVHKYKGVGVRFADLISFFLNIL